MMHHFTSFGHQPNEITGGNYFLCVDEITSSKRISVIPHLALINMVSIRLINRIIFFYKLIGTYVTNWGVSVSGANITQQ